MQRLDKEIAALIKENKWQEIINLLNPVIENGDFSVTNLKNLGFAHSRLGHHHKARKYYKMWMQKEPDKAQPYYNMGYTFYDQGKWKEAIHWFDLALERYPDYMLCLYRKGMALFFWDKIPKAAKSLQIAVNIYKTIHDPDLQRRMAKYYYRSTFYLGKCELNQGSAVMAQIWFEKNLEDQRHYVKPLFVRYNLAKAYLKSKDYAKAEQIIQTLAPHYENKEWLFDIWGRILHNMRQHRLAIEKFSMALKVRMLPYILIHRAGSYFEMGDMELAKQDLYEALRRDRKGRHKILLKLAEIAMEQKQFSKAENLAKRAMEFKKKIYDVDYANAHYFLYKLYDRMDKTEESIEELKLAEKLYNQWEWGNEKEISEFLPPYETEDEHKSNDE